MMPVSTRFAAVLPVLALVAGCSSFSGLPHDAGVDAPLPKDRNTPPDLVDRAETAPPVDAGPPDDAAPFQCGMGRGPCDPVTGGGCPGGQDCRIVDAVTFQAACGAAGGGIAGTECRAESDCGPGLHCLTPPAGFCARLCCQDEGDTACRRLFGRYSRCSIATNSVLIYGCTVNNACDYVDRQGCAPGLECAPTNGAGAARCYSPGTSAVGSSCNSAIDCVAGATCFFTRPMPPGACREHCNPIGANRCPIGLCRGFSDRPADWGVCAGP